MSLAMLRDMHTPPPISNWPPAPGWIVLCVILLGLLLGSAISAYLWYRKQALRRRSLKQLARLQRNFKADPRPLHSCRAVAGLLRQVAAAKFGRRTVSQLYGETWIAFLNQQTPQSFTDNTAALLLQAPYQPQLTACSDTSACDALFTATENWIKAHV